MTDVLVVANPAAGATRPEVSVGEVAHRLRALGADVEASVPASSAAASELIEAAVGAGTDRIVVIGGDGVVHLAAQHMAGTGAVLGVVPSGTGNDFARAVGLPTDIEDSCRRCLDDAVALDALRVGDRWVASVATFGFSAAVNARANAMRRPRGSRRYTVATLLELPHLHSTDITFRSKQGEHAMPVTLAAVANTGYFGGGMAIAPEADPADGLMDVVAVGEVGRIELLRFFPKVFSAAHTDHRAVHMFRCRQLRLEGSNTEVWGDGEPVTAIPVDIRCVPDALRVAGATP